MVLNLSTISAFLVVVLSSAHSVFSHLQSKPTNNLPLPPTPAPVYRSNPGNPQVHNEPGNHEHSLNSSQPSFETDNPRYTTRANAPVPTDSGHSYHIIPFTTAAYNRDVYGTSRDSAGNPIFGVSSNGDFQLSAYFGQIFWSAVTLVATIVASVYVTKLVSGYDIVSGMVNKIRGTVATAKSLDLEHLTNMVYEAFETYGKYAAKEARHEIASVLEKKTGEKKQRQ